MGLNEKFFKTSAVDNTRNFATVLYSGDGGNKSISTVGMKPDLVWVKQRTSPSRNHIISNSISSANITNSLAFTSSNNNEREYTGGEASGTYIRSLDSNGFSVGSSNFTGASGEDYVAFCWRAPDSETNTSGTINTTVKKNVDAGFSILTYTGASNATADTSNNGGGYYSVGHSLGVAPALVIVKKTNSGGDWYVGGTALGSTGANGNHLVLSTSAAIASESNILWGGAQTFNATTFGLGGWDVVNRNGDSYVAYCFADITDYQKIGTYNGTNGVGTNTISTGFEPSFLLVKNVSAGNSWNIFDNKRSPSNNREISLFANLSAAEFDYTTGGASSLGLQFFSTGFQFVATNNGNRGEVNGATNQTYIYLAIA